MKIKPDIFVFIIFILIITTKVCSGANISADGGCSFNFDASNLLSGAGSNFAGSPESTPDQIDLTIANTGGAGWRISAQKIDALWNNNLLLWIRRNDISADYQQIDNINRTVFTGTGDNILPLQFKLSGISVSVPPGVYNTTVSYTITAP